MESRKAIITERDGRYELENEGISHYALIGILECVLFDLKNADRRERSVIASDNSDALVAARAAVTKPVEKVGEDRATESETAAPSASPKAATEPSRETAPPLAAAPDVRTRIGNAVRAIRSLGGQIEDSDLSGYSDEELQTELEELTAQYKRLKNSKGKK